MNKFFKLFNALNFSFNINLKSNIYNFIIIFTNNIYNLKKNFFLVFLSSFYFELLYKELFKVLVLLIVILLF